MSSLLVTIYNVTNIYSFKCLKYYVYNTVLNVLIKTPHRDAARVFSFTRAAGNENEKKRHRKRGKERQMVWSV